MKLKYETQRFISDLKSIQWLANAGCGEGSEVKYVRRMSEVKKALGQRTYRGLLTEFINFNQALRLGDKAYATQSAQVANARAAAIGQESDALLSYVLTIRPELRTVGAETALANHFDGLISEIEFGQEIPNAPYQRYLLPWYERGHFPCGWSGKLNGDKLKDYRSWRLPPGNLVVF